MKRFGEKATREAIANGAIIRAWDWYTLEAGYRVIIDGETAGYIVGDLFAKLHNDGTIIKDHWAHSYTDYKAAQEATDDDQASTSTDDQEAAPAALEQYNVSYNEDGVYQTILVNAASIDDAADYFKAQTPGAIFIAAKKATRDDQRPGKPCLTVPADFRPAEAEKTAQEWNEESDRVQAATLAALAPVIAAEEAAPAAEAAPAKLTPYERVTAKNPDYPNAWRLPGYPGAIYTIEATDARGGAWTVHRPTKREYQDELASMKRDGYTITRTTKTEAGQVEEIPAETYQEETDRENREHCQRIAEELEAYADGRVYRCPECGQDHSCDDLEPTEDDAGDTCCTCPSCGQHSSWTAWEELSLYDYFSDCLDIEYRCGSDREYRSVCIMVACGGPNIYIDTASKNVELYWWTDRAHYPISYEAVDAVDDWAREYWDCL